MTDIEIAELARWIAAAGLAGKPETHLLEGFCSRAAAAGLPLSRGMVFIDTLHPVHEGRAFRWDRDGYGATLTEYGPTVDGERAERWRSSPHFVMQEQGESRLCRRLTEDSVGEF